MPKRHQLFFIFFIGIWGTRFIHHVYQIFIPQWRGKKQCKKLGYVYIYMTPCYIFHVSFLEILLLLDTASLLGDQFASCWCTCATNLHGKRNQIKIKGTGKKEKEKSCRKITTETSDEIPFWMSFSCWKLQTKAPNTIEKENKPIGSKELKQGTFILYNLHHKQFESGFVFSF